ncbi:MAG: hypothetical protein Q4B42_07200 [Oscillospiraceae bacterium]|nr:hypothetical protein [Oscillospiraceae bacterium]
MREETGPAGPLLNRIFMWLCLAAFSMLAAAFLSADCAGLLPAALCALLLGLFFLFCKYAVPCLEKLPAKRISLCFYILLALWLALSLVYAASYVDGLTPRGDYEAIHTGVKEAVEFGHLTDSNPYFLRYSHQRGTLALLSAYFYILQRLGICATVDLFAGAVLVRLGAALAAALSYAALKRVWGAPGALAASLLLLSCPPFFTACTYYSISLGLPFAAAGLRLYITARGCEGGRLKKAALFALDGAVWAAGAVVSGTVYVLIAAVLIHLFLTSGFKRFLPRIAALALGFALLLGCFNLFIRHSGIMDFTNEQKELLPLGYWLMVAVKDEGLYNEEDYQTIVSLPDYEARVEYTRGELKRLLGEMSLGDFLKLAWTKTRLTWTAAGYSGSPPQGLSASYRAAWGSALSLIMLFGALRFFKAPPAAHTLWLLSGFGLVLFFFIWEAKPGALLTVYPVLSGFGALAAQKKARPL